MMTLRSVVLFVALLAVNTTHGFSFRRARMASTDLEISAFVCEREATSSTQMPNGVTVERSTSTGIAVSTPAIASGPFQVNETVVVGANGRGRVYGQWRLDVTGSSGELKGHYFGRITDGSVSNLRHFASGRGSLRFTFVRFQSTDFNGVIPENAPCEAVGGFSGTGNARRFRNRAPRGAVVASSTKSFQDTVGDLTDAINANPNLVLVRTIDHQAAGASRGLDLPPTIELFFGNPNLGTPLMQSSQSTGIDLPQKMLVWEDLFGDVRVAYNAPSYLQSRHGLEGVDNQLNTIAGALAGLASAATGSTVEPTFDAGSVGAGQGLVSTNSTKAPLTAFEDVVDALEAAPPVNVALEVQHDVNAQNNGLELRPTKLVVFGNPSLGTLLMQSDQTIALDLPVKILVLEDEQGDTKILSNDMAFLAKRHRIKDQDGVVNTINGAVANFVSRGV